MPSVAEMAEHKEFLPRACTRYLFRLFYRRHIRKVDEREH